MNFYFLQYDVISSPAATVIRRRRSTLRTSTHFNTSLNLNGHNQITNSSSCHSLQTLKMTDAHFFIPAIKIEKESDDDFTISSSVIEIFKELEIKHESKIATEKEEAKERKRLRAKKYASREDVKEKKRIAEKKRNAREDVKERVKKYRKREDVKEKAKKYRKREDVKEKAKKYRKREDVKERAKKYRKREDVKERAKKYREREDVKENKRISENKRNAREDVEERAKKYHEREDVKEKKRIAENKRNAREDVEERAKKYQEREDVKEKKRIADKERYAREGKNTKNMRTKPTSTPTQFRCILPKPVPTTPQPVTCLPVIEIPFVERSTEPEKRLPPNASHRTYTRKVKHRTREDEIDVEFDDGDNSRIPVSQIKLLPPDYPVLERDPEPLLQLEDLYDLLTKSSV